MWFRRGWMMRSMRAAATRRNRLIRRQGGGRCGAESMDGDLGSVLGLVWHGRVVLGLVMQGNYPATDQVWPRRCRELGIVVLIGCMGCGTIRGF